MYLFGVISQLSNDWDSDPDVRESCRAPKPARGAALFPLGCWVSVYINTKHHILNFLTRSANIGESHTDISSSYQRGLLGFDFSEQDFTLFCHHHRTLIYCALTGVGLVSVEITCQRRDTTGLGWTLVPQCWVSLTPLHDAIIYCFIKCCMFL